MPLADAGLCCGSAGLYNIEQPALAGELGRRKAAAIVASGARLAVTGNIGCMTQLETTLAAGGHDLAVRHTMEVLARAGPGRGDPGTEAS